MFDTCFEVFSIKYELSINSFRGKISYEIWNNESFDGN